MSFMLKLTPRPLFVKTPPRDNLCLYGYISSRLASRGGRDELLHAPVVPRIAPEGLPDPEHGPVRGDIDPERREDVVAGPDVEQIRLSP